MAAPVARDKWRNGRVAMRHSAIPEYLCTHKPASSLPDNFLPPALHGKDLSKSITPFAAEVVVKLVTSPDFQCNTQEKLSLLENLITSNNKIHNIHAVLSNEVLKTKTKKTVCWRACKQLLSAQAIEMTSSQTWFLFASTRIAFVNFDWTSEVLFFTPTYSKVRNKIHIYKFMH